MTDSQNSKLPEGARQITTEELLQVIGELYIQSRIYQKLLADQSQQLVNGAISERIPT